MRSSLALLATLATALVLAATGGREAAPGSRQTVAGPGSNVALRIAVPRPADRVPSIRLALAAGDSPFVSEGDLAHWSNQLVGMRVDAQRDLLARLSWLELSIERSCPPPALLACRPALRALAGVRPGSARGLGPALRAAVVAGLRAAGYRRLEVESRDGDAIVAGRVTSAGETLASWRGANGLLEVATIGLELSGAAAAVQPPRELEVERNPTVTAALLAQPR